jgi:hypothetical protein
MLSNFSQFSPQGLMPQFSGLQGLPQMNPGLFGQPGAYNGNVQFGHEFGQAGLSQQPGLGGQTFLQNPFAQNPFLGAGHAGVNVPAQHIVVALAQLAQQIAVQSAVAQQIGITVQQLAHQLAVQSLQPIVGGGYGAGQVFAGQQGGFGQGGYGGFNPQAQAWGANRQTIQ